MATEQRVPSAIGRQVAEAAQIQAALDAAAAAAPPVTDPIADILRTPAPPPPAPAPTLPTSAPATPPAPAPAPATPPAPPPPAPPPAQTSPSISQEALNEILATNRRLVEQMQRTQAPAPAPAAPEPLTPKPVASAHTDEEKRVFGDDVLNMVEAKIDRKLAPLFHALSRVEGMFSQVTGQVQHVQQATQLSAEQMMVATLDRAVPDWNAVNSSPGFQRWCGEVDPLLGEPRQAAIERAVGAHDGARLSAIFKAYKSSAAPAPAPAPQPNGMESMVAPTTVAGEAPAPAPAAPIFTSAQVKSFHNDVARGRYRGREAEAERITKAIDEAAAAGRISP